MCLVNCINLLWVGMLNHTPIIFDYHAMCDTRIFQPGDWKQKRKKKCDMHLMEAYDGKQSARNACMSIFTHSTLAKGIFHVTNNWYRHSQINCGGKRSQLERNIDERYRETILFIACGSELMIIEWNNKSLCAWAAPFEYTHTILLLLLLLSLNFISCWISSFWQIS